MMLAIAFLMVDIAAPSCTEGCHDGVGKKAKVLHGALAKGKCRACHRGKREEPPAPDHVRNVAMTPKAEAACRACHRGVVKKLRAGEAHGPATSDCLICHQPHASDHDKLLKAVPAKLCVICHEPFAGKVVHSPVATGDCLFCHDPHASPHPFVLVKPANSLCGQCHEEPHGKAAKRTECVTCHLPHASERRALLRKN